MQVSPDYSSIFKRRNCNARTHNILRKIIWWGLRVERPAGTRLWTLDVTLIFKEELVQVPAVGSNVEFLNFEKAVEFEFEKRFRLHFPSRIFLSLRILINLKITTLQMIWYPENRFVSLTLIRTALELQFFSHLSNHDYNHRLWTIKQYCYCRPFQYSTAFLEVWQKWQLLNTKNCWCWRLFLSLNVLRTLLNLSKGTKCCLKPF